MIQHKKTVRIEIKGTEFGGTFYYNRTDHVFFRALARKTTNDFSSHGTGAIRWASATMVYSSACGPSVPVLLNGARWQQHGLRPLPPAPWKSSGGWCIAQQSTMASFYKKNRHPGRRQPWPPLPLMVRPRSFCSMALVDNTMGNAPYRRRY